MAATGGQQNPANYVHQTTGLFHGRRRQYILSVKHCKTMMADESVPLKQDEEYEAFEENVIRKHRSIVDSNMNKICRIELIGFCESFCDISRSSVRILYARQFENSIFVISAMKCIGM